MKEQAYWQVGDIIGMIQNDNNKEEEMKYLIIYTDPTTGEVLAFYTNWFNPENHFNPDCDMIVVDRTRHLFTTDGETWDEIEEDHL